LNSKSQIEDWRNKLKEGDKVDCCDRSNKWHDLTILQLQSVEVKDQTIYYIKVELNDQFSLSYSKNNYGNYNNHYN